jgi:hypothetical protein
MISESVMETGPLMRVSASLERATARLRQMRRFDSAGIVTAFLAGLIGTLVAGSPVALKHAPGGHWPTVCLLAAVCSAIATGATGLRQAFGSSEKLVTISACVARLKALEFSMSTGLTAGDKANEAYAQIVEKYAEFLT